MGSPTQWQADRRHYSHSIVSKDVGWWEWDWYNKGTGLLLTEGAPGIEIGRQSIDDSGIVCTQMVLRWCTAGAALQPLLLLPCCNPPAALLLLPSCCCPAETHLTPPAGGGG